MCGASNEDSLPGTQIDQQEIEQNRKWQNIPRRGDKGKVGKKLKKEKEKNK